MKRKFLAVLAICMVAITCTIAFVSCSKSEEPEGGGELPKIDVFEKNAEYKDFYDTIEKLEKALFKTEGVATMSSIRILSSAYKDDNSINGIADAVKDTMDTLATDEQNGFTPEAMPEMYSVYKNMFSSSFSLAKQIGDGITRIKGESSFYGKTVKVLDAKQSADSYYVAEKDGNHVYQLVYYPQTITQIEGTNEVDVRKESFSFVDMYYVSESNYGFSMISITGENESVTFAYGDNQNKFAYGVLSDDQLSSFSWADGDLKQNTKQITSSASSQECEKLSSNFDFVYNYLDKAYFRNLASRNAISLTKEDFEKILDLWAEQSGKSDADTSPWIYENNVLTGCDFVSKNVEPTETVTIPDGVVAISSEFRIFDNTGTVKNLVIPASCEQVKKLVSNRWETADNNEFRPYISSNNAEYNLESVTSYSPLFKADEKSGTLVTSDNKAFYLFDKSAEVYDLSGVELDDNFVANNHGFKNFVGVKTLVLSANKKYYPTSLGANGEITFKYDISTICDFVAKWQLNLNKLEIRFGNAPDPLKTQQDTAGDKYDIANRLTIKIANLVNGGTIKDRLNGVSIDELKIVSDSYKFVLATSELDSIFSRVSVGGELKLISDNTTELDITAYNVFGNVNGKISTVTVNGNYGEIAIEEEIDVDNYSAVAIELSPTAKFLSLKFNPTPFRYIASGSGAAESGIDGAIGGDVQKPSQDNKVLCGDDYVFTSPCYIVKLPITQETMEKSENYPYLYRVFGNDYETIKDNDWKSSNGSVQYQFAQIDCEESVLISDYWVNDGKLLLGYIDETGSCGSTLKLPYDCNALEPQNMQFLTINKISTIVIPQNYRYYHVQNGTYSGVLKSVIEESDAGLFSWTPKFFSNGSAVSYTFQSITLEGNSPLFSLVDGEIRAKNGLKLPNFVSSEIVIALPPYPSTDGTIPTVTINQEFLDNGDYNKYNFSNVGYVAYDRLENSSIVIDLGLLNISGVQLFGIMVGDANVESVDLNLNGNKLTSFSIGFMMSKETFESLSQEKQEMFWNGLFDVPENYTFADFKNDGYVYDKDGTSIQFNFYQ